MEEETYYSVRMRASRNAPHEQGGKHISGGERLITYSGIQEAVNGLLHKGFSHSRGTPDFMQIQLESVNGPIKTIRPLPITVHQTDTAEKGQAIARTLLQKAGIPPRMIEKAYQNIAEYAEARGAVLFDIRTGKRIDGRRERGVRVSRMDWPAHDFQKWALDHNMPENSRIKEAHAIAAKVCAHPGIIAEVCWSDDPDYITGYVASKELGYQRITKMKNDGDESGCRIFFTDGITDTESCIRFLEKQPVFIQREGNI
ncbi:6-carboxyhexanoate--CoA ligase [Bacillus siamensis]|uniref:6-carboxyhexanoate--CoA ligase n=1 Tax=Bacillus siamensis TaxID=659243 RepID=UPI0039EBD5E5